VNYRLVVPVVMLCCTISPAFAQAAASEKARTPLEETLMDAEKSFVAAAKKGDAAFFKRTLASDFSFVNFDGELTDRQEMIDSMSGGGFDILPYDMTVVPVTDDVAIATYNVVLRIPPTEDQGPPPRYQRFSTVWVKQGGNWKMKFLQMSVAHFGDW
jgi:ketosteroid isomerase-like protein